MGEADIGIRVFLDDAASQGLYAIDGTLGRIGTNLISADGGMRRFTGSLAALGVLTGFAASLVLFGGALKFSVDSANEFQQSMFGIAVATHVSLDEAMKFSTQLMNLAANSTFTSKDIADGIAQLGRAGYSIDDIFKATKDSAYGMAGAGVALGIAIRTDAVSGFQLLAQVMAEYKAPAEQAMHYADLLQFAFEHQRGSVSEFSSGMSQAAQTAAYLNTPLEQIVAALDVAGPVMKSTSMAGTALRYALSGVLQPTGPAIEMMQKLGLASYDAGGKFHSAFFNADGSAKDLTQILTILHDKLKGMSQEDQLKALKAIFSVKGGQGIDALLNNFDKYIKYVDQLKQHNDNAGGAMQRWNQVMGTFGGAWAGLTSSIKDLGVVIGMQLLPFLTQVITKFNNFVSTIRTMVGPTGQSASNFLKLGAALSGLGIVGTIVGMAIAGILPPILMFAGIALLVTAATIGLTVGIMMLANWFRQTITSATPLGNFLRQLGAVFSDLGAFIRTNAITVWNNLKAAMSPLGPAFAQLGAALRPLLPVFGFLAVIIGAVLIGAIHGIVLALTFFITGLAHVLAGVIQFVAGFLTYWAGFLNLLIGLVTLNGARITQGWNTIWQGLRMMAQGALQAIAGVFIAVFGTIIGFVWGFVLGVINFFTHLWSVLVGHSIIPDMLNAIRNVFMNVLNAVVSFVVGFVLNLINHFLQMGTMIVTTAVNAFNMFRAAVQVGINAALSFVTSGLSNMISHVIQFGSQLLTNAHNAWDNFRNAVSNGINSAVNIARDLPGRIIGAIAGLGTMLFNSGANAMKQFADGLGSMLSAVTDKVAQAGNTISNFLAHHSPAKMGPLADDDKWMPNMMKMMAEGIDQHTPLLAQAAQRAAGGIASAPSTARMGTPTPGFGAGGMSGGNITVPLVVDGNTIGQVVINRLTGQMQMNGFSRSFR